MLLLKGDVKVLWKSLSNLAFLHFKRATSGQALELVSICLAFERAGFQSSCLLDSLPGTWTALGWLHWPTDCWFPPCRYDRWHLFLLPSSPLNISAEALFRRLNLWKEREEITIKNKQWEWIYIKYPKDTKTVSVVSNSWEVMKKRCLSEH